MKRLSYLKSLALGGASAVALASAASADQFNIPGGDLKAALHAYSTQTGVPLIASDEAVKNARSRGAKGELTAELALSRILAGTGFVAHREATAIAIVPGRAPRATEIPQPAQIRMAAKSAAAGIESVVVTSSKIKGDIQTVPIAITALSQEQLTERQIAGGPDLVKEVPNLTFTKTNFTGYNLQIRGIGTQAVSVTIDPAVAVAFNDTPFLRNHFFEQEFYDVSQVEVLRGPQGTLFGRNANAGVVNLVSAKPADQFEAMLSADFGNFHNRRFEGMINIPITDEKLALRVSGEWTKRDGYAFNEIDGQQIDGRDLWSTRATLRWKPTSEITADLIWEHFQESDDRLRSGKQLCHNDPGPTTFTGPDGSAVHVPDPHNTIYDLSSANFSQGCLPGSLYDMGDPAHGDHGAFGVPNGFSLPFVTALGFTGALTHGLDPYASDHQSTNLRNIESTVPSEYRANNDTLELNAEWHVAPALTVDSETGYNRDFLWSLEDFNRFETSPGIFAANYPSYFINPMVDANGVYCDHQLGCSDRLVSEDLSTETAWQFSQEFRLTSDFEGPFNFSAGGNYLHYETEDKFYVFSNAFSIIAYNGNRCERDWMPGISDALHCLRNGRQYPTTDFGGVPTQYPTYLDPNPFESLNDNGHNYFLSKNPYVLNSYALFGEAYYQLTNELKLTGGLRWTDDKKHFPLFPSRTLDTDSYGIQREGEINQSWEKFSGRAVVNWTPKLDFTDQTLVYASYSHGYKAGGANPPPAVLAANQSISFPLHPRTFEPEYIDAYELGTKNTLLDGGLVLNGDVFYYDYKAYQISQLIDRTSVNINVDATVRGAELSATYSPAQGLKFTFNGGYEDTKINDNQYFIDLMDRTYGHHDTWTIIKPWAGEASNCVFPTYVAAALVVGYAGYGQGNPATQSCGLAYSNTIGVGNTGHQQVDPVTSNPYTPYPSNADFGNGTGAAGLRLAGIYPGYDPLAGTPDDPYTGQNTAHGVDFGPVPNNGQGFEKPIGGNELPNAPHFTVSLTGEYTMPISDNWAATLHSDFYWQSQSFARIFNDRPYDKIRGYSNVNMALILNDASGWQVMGYVKNIFDVTAITGDFLYTDDVGLTTNIFLTDPRLYGVRITKHFDGGEDAGSFSLFSGEDGKKPQVWLTLGGNFMNALSAKNESYAYDYTRPGGGGVPAGTMSLGELIVADGFPSPESFQKTPQAGFDWEGQLAFQPEDSDWVLKAGIRYGRSSKNSFIHKSLAAKTKTAFIKYGYTLPCTIFGSIGSICSQAYDREFIDEHGHQSEQHTILDFTLGKDVGIGLFGNGSISAGVRAAQFKSRASTDVNTDPELVFEPAAKYHNVYESLDSEKRTFHGIGPEIAWDANSTLWGNPNDGEITLDWGVNAALLFGKQRVDEQHFTSYCHVSGNIGFAYCTPVLDTQTRTTSRSRSVTVPNLGGYAGLSVRYSNAKVSFGYRTDNFFNAMDGGQDAAKKYNRSFNGPYLNLSIGMGG